jgi:hypothetical protein
MGGMKIEKCIECDEPTGRAGKCEESLYVEESGPFCEACFKWKAAQVVMPTDYDRSIHSNPDAQAWAKFFCETFPGADEALMIGWFANSMMAMHDHVKTEAKAEVEQLNAHTWEQERAAVVKWLGSAKDSHPVIIKLLSYVLDCIEKGEHWPEGEKT